jgi:hypothetical protein
MSTAAKRRVKPSVTKAVPGLFTRLKEKYRRFQQQKQVQQPKQQMSSTAKPGLLARLKNKYGSKHQQEPNQQQQQQQPIQHQQQQQHQQPVVIEEWMLIESDLTQRSELVNAVRAFRDTTETENAWLNDNSIDLHLQMILAQHNHNNVTFLSAQFYTRLTNPIYSYGDLRNWVNKLGVIFHSSTTDMKVFIPINYGSDHWVLSFLDFKTKQYSYYDSLHLENNTLWAACDNLAWFGFSCLENNILWAWNNLTWFGFSCLENNTLWVAWDNLTWLGFSCLEKNALWAAWDNFWDWLGLDLAAWRIMLSGRLGTIFGIKWLG